MPEGKLLWFETESAGSESNRRPVSGWQSLAAGRSAGRGVVNPGSGQDAERNRERSAKQMEL